MDMSYLVVVSFVGLALLALGNQMVTTVMNREKRGRSGPFDSVGYVLRQPGKCLKGAILMGLGVLCLIVSTVLPMVLAQPHP
nr:hypothetical protein [uncultured Holophaga sp.]